MTPGVSVTVMSGFAGAAAEKFATVTPALLPVRRDLPVSLLKRVVLPLLGLPASATVSFAELAFARTCTAPGASCIEQILQAAFAVHLQCMFFTVICPICPRRVVCILICYARTRARELFLRRQQRMQSGRRAVRQKEALLRHPDICRRLSVCGRFRRTSASVARRNLHRFLLRKGA